MLPLLKAAAAIALPTSEQDQRNFWLGAVGVRKDGAIVGSKNGSTFHSTSVNEFRINPNAHAEGRLLRKLGRHGVIYVARVSKKNGDYAMAKPCEICSMRIKAYDVKKVYFTINQTQYGVWNVVKDTYKFYNVS